MASQTVSQHRRAELTSDALRIHLRTARKNLIQAAQKADKLGDSEIHRDLMVNVSALDDLTEKLA